MLLAFSLLVAAQAVTPPGPLEPLAFLVGHCWQGEIRPGETNVHCFDRVDGRVRDRHDVIRGGETVYSGETIYDWDHDAQAISFLYSSGGAVVGRGHVRAIEGGLDFGRSEYGSDANRVSIASRWMRAGGDAYDAIDQSAAAAFNRTTRYTRTDEAPVRVLRIVAPDGTRTLVHEAVVSAPADQVYAALATADGWQTWAVPHAWADPMRPAFIETSYAPDARIGDPANIRQEFLLRLPNRLIVFRTTQTPPGFPHADAYRQVTSLFELLPEGSGTRVRLTGTNYPADAAGDQLVSFFREGNRASLEQLRARFVTGPVDWAARRGAGAQ